MTKVTPTSSRKTDHLRINIEEDTRSGITTGFENYRFIHQALPEINLDDIVMGVNLFGKSLQKPLLISSMTGGTEKAGQINENLAIAAQETGVALGVGSQRAAIEDPSVAWTYEVRQHAPDVLLMANLGVIQLNNGFTTDDCQKAVDMIEADALILHLNPLQEAVQPGGNTNFSGLLPKIEEICKLLSVPVIAKEVGWGISKKTAQQLCDAGISAIDVAGAGGTSWSQVEMHRAETESQTNLAKIFKYWGIPTAESVINVTQICRDIPVIASGGIRNGLDAAKSIALGAKIAGSASAFLISASKSPEAVIRTINDFSLELRVTMFACGAATPTELSDKLTIINFKE